MSSRASRGISCMRCCHTLFEDSLSSDQLKWADACPVDERTLADLMGEIQDPALRLKLLRLCVELAEADAHVAEGELIVLVAAVEHWSPCTTGWFDRRPRSQRGDSPDPHSRLHMGRLADHHVRCHAAWKSQHHRVV